MASRVPNYAPPGSLLKRPGQYLSTKGEKTDRDARVTDDAYLALIRKCPCLSCGEDHAGEAAHVRVSSAAFHKRSTGMSRKPDDRWTLPLCHTHHMQQHQVGELTFWYQLGISPVFLCSRLYAASPDLEAMRAICFEPREARSADASRNGG